MCGIAGLAALDGGAVDPAPLRAMCDALRHRGPDDEGTWSEGTVALGNRRLSIIDLSGGHQPMASEDGRVVVVQNGEIYNHEALHAELEAAGHRFATRCDTEVLVHGWEQWGEGLFERLRGMFAVAVWDTADRRLVLARDRFGIKPLYWTAQRGLLAFASELKALRVLGIDEQVDLDALEAYLAFNSIPHPLTIFRGTSKLPPGHLLSWSPGSDPAVREWRRERPAPAGALRGESEDELAAEVRDAMRDSVRAHLVSDVPVGVFLSGGVDSGTLTALAAELTPGRVSTFSIGFEESSFDELETARLVARRYDTDHHELVLRVGGDRVTTLLPEIVAAFDEPFGDSSVLPTYLVSQLAAKHVKVALSGEGGDELFGGYYTYVANLLAPRLAPLARVARPFVGMIPSSSRRVSLDYKARRFVRAAHLPPVERHHGFKEILAPDLREQLLSGRRGADPLAQWREHWAATEGAEELARLQELDLNLYLPSDLLVKTDRASMAHSLEARVPFLDEDVARLAFSLPTAMKVRGRQKKRLLRKAVEPLLPAEVVHGAKRGFSIPAAAWFRGELEPFARETLSNAQLVDRGVALRLLDEHVARRDDHSRALWGLVSLELWRAGP